MGMRLRLLLVLLLHASHPALAETHAWHASVPRAHWPCASFEKGPDRSGDLVRFHYGAVTSCKVPSALTHEGFVGCPLRLTVTRGNQAFDISRFGYARGRLVSNEDPKVSSDRITWTGGEPHFADELALKIRKRAVEWGSGGKVDLRVEVDAKSRPLRATSWNTFADPPTVDERLTYEWKGDRLLRVLHFDGSSAEPEYALELVYDCRELPPEPPLANAGKPIEG